MRPSLLVGLALLLGAMTAFMAAQWVASGSATAKPPAPRLVLAAVPIEAGTVLGSTQLKTVEWSGPALPAQSLQDVSSAVGRVVRYPLAVDEPVLETKLAPTDARAGLSAVIGEGKRAISVRVNEVIGVAGFALPGSFVDVLVSGKDQGQQAFSKTVISRAKVLAVAQDTTADPSKPKVTNAVTLELSPTEAERLDLARSVGTLSLVLRNEVDQSPWSSPGARMSDLLNASPGEKDKSSALTRATTRAETSASAVEKSSTPQPTQQRLARKPQLQDIRGLELGQVQP